MVKAGGLPVGAFDDGTFQKASNDHEPSSKQQAAARTSADRAPLE